MMSDPCLPYTNLARRLNRFPQGAPAADSLYKILKVLFSEREAELVAQLPIKPFSARQAARVWKMNESEATKILDELASRAILIDGENDGKLVYTLPPPMAGFFEFSLMRRRDDIDQKLLSEYFHQYITIEDDFMRDLLASGKTQVGRVFVNEEVLPAVTVLEYEQASEIISTSTSMGVSLCFCRHKASLLGNSCDAPVDDICMTFGNVARSLARHGYARLVDKGEGKDLLQKAYEHHLVQFGENVRREVSFICNCCGCCCEAMLAARRFAFARPISTSRFLPKIDLSKCNGCGKCVDICPVNVMALVSANDPHNKHRKMAILDEENCLGCGVCARVCPRQCIRLVERKVRVITPLNSVHRLVMMAIERGKLHHLIVDEQVMANQRLMAQILRVLLALPPLKRVLASEQVKSRYLEALLARVQI